MTARRTLLALGSAAIAAPPLPAIAALSPDAALIRNCARYLELERIMNDPMHPAARLDCDEMPEWPEYVAVQAAVLAAVPQTMEGIAALARMALLSGSVNDGSWDDNDAQRIAHTLLERLAGPGLAEDRARQAEEKRRRSAIITARYAGAEVAP